MRAFVTNLPSVALAAGLVAAISPPGTALGGQPRVPSTPPEQIVVQGKDYRLQARVFRANVLSSTPILLVVLHGDSPLRDPSYHYDFAEQASQQNQDLVAVALLRPGYKDPQGHQSDGEKGQAIGDNYNVTNTDAIADAIGVLKRRWRARRVVVAGHSGGAAITANILGRHPALIDAALLVSCPCDVERWRQHMAAFYEGKPAAALFRDKIETLSPIDLVKGISPRAEITMIVGSQDDVAPVDLTVAYRAAAATIGNRIRLIELTGKDHDIFLDPAVLTALAPMLDMK
jgi:dienelactone hydrolase